MTLFPTCGLFIYFWQKSWTRSESKLCCLMRRTTAKENTTQVYSLNLGVFPWRITWKPPHNPSWGCMKENFESFFTLLHYYTKHSGREYAPRVHVKNHKQANGWGVEPTTTTATKERRRRERVVRESEYTPIGPLRRVWSLTCKRGREQANERNASHDAEDWKKKQARERSWSRRHGFEQTRESNTKNKRLEQWRSRQRSCSRSRRRRRRSNARKPKHYLHENRRTKDYYH